MIYSGMPSNLSNNSLNTLSSYSIQFQHNIHDKIDVKTVYYEGPASQEQHQHRSFEMLSKESTQNIWITPLESPLHEDVLISNTLE